jgi:TIR domain-containing protein
MATLFFSYSHRDEAMRDQLETHLAMLKRQGFIETWHDRRIAVGEAFDTAISDNLERADIVLLLVSPDFIASDYCYDREMTRALERHAAGLCTVIPVILRACDWHDAPFGRLLAAPKDGRPITQWPDIDAAFLEVTTAIKVTLRKHENSPKDSSTRSPEVFPPLRKAAPPSGERSSNLRVTKRFTDRDKDHFLHDAFEFMARFFENSLAELAARNPGIEGQFRRVDANRFIGVAYRDGDAVARCSVFLGDRTGFMSGISYSYDDSTSTTSFNESLSVEHDDQILYLKALGMSMRRQSEGKLSPEGGAELYWGMFIEPFQRGGRI